MRARLSNATPSWDANPADHATLFFSVEESSHVTDVARTLAAHGGGAVSVDLAFDLVLNEVVGEARNASGATGAAIALFRDGELVCRATSGENAPDLGVRVETASSLAGTCVTTGEMQLCRDTDSDPRVNAEACRRLGVRSMLIAPLVDTQKVFGILQVFSAWPNAFGNREISAVQVLAGRIAESNREAQTEATAGPTTGAAVTTPDAVRTTLDTPQTPEQREPSPEPESAPFSGLIEDEARPPRTETWSAILVVLVIATAILLGVVIGWRKAAMGTGARAQVQAVAVAPPTQTTDHSVVETQTTPEAADSAEAPKAAPAVKTSSASPAVDPPSGGLVVTQNGKVIYRSPLRPAPAPAKPQPSTNRLIYRVEPEYPAQAREQGVQGAVVLDVQVLGTGTVGNITVISGDRLLADAAVHAVKQWRYQPYLVDGSPVESDTRITIRFTLPSN